MGGEKGEDQSAVCSLPEELGFPGVQSSPDARAPVSRGGALRGLVPARERFSSSCGWEQAGGAATSRFPSQRPVDSPLQGPAGRCRELLLGPEPVFLQLLRAVVTPSLTLCLALCLPRGTRGLLIYSLLFLCFGCFYGAATRPVDFLPLSNL